MHPEILIRKQFAEDGEVEAATKYFYTTNQRTEIVPGALIIPRYSSLPYYEELEKDVENLNCNLIQTFKEHNWIASFDYYNELADFTFKTWEEREFYLAPEGPYVVKGKTNSKKWRWNTQMFATNKKDAIKIAGDLYNDEWIGSQGIIFREYTPLRKLEEGINGVNFANEFRFFFLGETLIDYSYYWACAENPPEVVPDEAVGFAHQVAEIAKNFTNFFVVDVAEKEAGGYILVELNCGTMSGLSLIEPENFYKNLKWLLSDGVL